MQEKCPNCGGILQNGKCSYCGFEVKGEGDYTNDLQAFTKKVNELLSQKKATSLKDEIKHAYGMKRADVVEEQIINLIITYNVGESKEEILEFLNYASSSINYKVLSSNSYTSDVGISSQIEYEEIKKRSDAWYEKSKRAYEKAKRLYGNDADFYMISNVYDSIERNIVEQREILKKKKRNLIIIFVGIFLFLVMALYFMGRGEEVEHKELEKKLEKTVDEIQIDISNGDYDAALIKANSLYMDDYYSSESKDYWDKQREELINLIEKKQEEASEKQ